jgi:hypothetical protein
MNYKEKLLSNCSNTKLSYLGAALLGLVLNIMFNLIITGNILFGIALYVAYMFIILSIEILCNHGVRYACHFNELWITLDELFKRKIGK